MRKVEITELDIRRGSKASAFFCPIARAVKRAYGLKMSSTDVGVSSAGVAIYPKRLDYFLPAKALKFMNAFDDGKKVKPFSFTLRLKKGE